MDAAEAKGALIAIRGGVLRVRPYGEGFVGLVEGDSGDVYRVFVSTKGYSCTCPYYAFTGKPCKHVYALAYYVEKRLGRNLLHHLLSESRAPHRQGRRLRTIGGAVPPKLRGSGP